MSRDVVPNKQLDRSDSPTYSKKRPKGTTPSDCEKPQDSSHGDPAPTSTKLKVMKLSWDENLPEQ